MSDNPYGILFEPVKIGPVTAPNRFYQVPHCTGMGYRYPNAEAAHRRVKAEGGWGVVSTQEVEIDPTSDVTPANEGRFWDDRDIPAMRQMTDAVHAHGSLAAIELVHNGLHVAARYSRSVPIGPSAHPSDTGDPIQARAMDKADIKAFRGWHRDAALRAKSAGFDIVYVYAGHDLTLLQHFLLARHNHRTDEYGGSFENRLRLFREVIADTRDAVGDSCGIAVRLAVDELMGDEGLQHDGEGRDVIEALAEEPDLWDVNISGWSNDSQTSRFAKEGFQDDYTRFVKSVTTKPVLGVGRYTSPDTMLRLVKSGHLDMIGAARPSIADPFLPNKIREGRTEDIRECIGCNICVSGDRTSVPMRCTQNPTVGEEWRRDWHPEIIGASEASEESVLVIGGGPAGLEAARGLVAAGRQVILAEASAHWGGRVTAESGLPGLAEWARVRDWRLGQLQRAANAELYLESALTAEDVLGYAIPHVAIATGAHWRDDGQGLTHRRGIAGIDAANVMTPDQVMAGELPENGGAGPIVVYDDEGFYMASLMAEVAARTGRRVIYLTPAAKAAPWSENTLEQARIHTRLIEAGVEIIALHKIAQVSKTALTLACIYSGATRDIPCDLLIPVTARAPNDDLWHDLTAVSERWPDAGLKTVTRIGDCLAPALIAGAVYSGHAYARGMTEGERPPKREDIVPIQA